MPAVQIKLDGIVYEISPDRLDRTPTKIATYRTTLTGALDVTDSGIVRTTYRYGLFLTAASLAALRTSFAKTGSSSKLDFTDAEGFTWNSGSGTTTSASAFSTGVLFTRMGAPKPVNPTGWGEMEVEIELKVSASGISS